MFLLRQVLVVVSIIVFSSCGVLEGETSVEQDHNRVKLVDPFDDPEFDFKPEGSIVIGQSQLSDVYGTSVSGYSHLSNGYLCTLDESLSHLEIYDLKTGKGGSYSVAVDSNKHVVGTVNVFPMAEVTYLATYDLLYEIRDGKQQEIHQRSPETTIFMSEAETLYSLEMDWGECSLVVRDQNRITLRDKEIDLEELFPNLTYNENYYDVTGISYGDRFLIYNPFHTFLHVFDKSSLEPVSSFRLDNKQLKRRREDNEGFYSREKQGPGATRLTIIGAGYYSDQLYALIWNSKHNPFILAVLSPDGEGDRYYSIPMPEGDYLGQMELHDGVLYFLIGEAGGGQTRVVSLDVDSLDNIG